MMMNVDLHSLLPESFSPNSRIWIYQSNRLLNVSEALHLEKLFSDFIKNWTAHGEAVKGYANLYFGQFIVLMADETDVTVSGCSTDSSVRFIKEIEKMFHISLFDRQSLAFLIDNKVQILPLSQLQYAFQNGFIQAETPYFNNLVSTKQEMLNQWIIPVEKSWLKTKLQSGINS